jgi:DNA-binding NtrC family response regulator
MPLNLQSKILRAAEEKVVTRIGDTNPIFTNFRIISATNHNIDLLVEKKKFRLDLLHRLNTIQIHIPPLRERPEDITPLLYHFAGEAAIKFNKHGIRIEKEAVKALTKYKFPGNVRELKNMIESAFILCKGKSIGIGDFHLGTPGKMATVQSPDSFNLRNHEIELLKNALRNCGNNQKAAADSLGITRDALIRKMKKYNININKVQD